MAVSFRRATPDDVEPAIPLIYSSGPTAFDFVFGSPKATAHDFLRSAYLDGKGTFGYPTHTVAIQAGVVVGIAATTTASGIGDMLTATRQIMRVYGASTPTIVKQGLGIERVIKPPKKGVHYIGHVGVDPDLRGQGIGTALMEHVIAEGRAIGRSTAELDVSVENPRAQELYERLGFRVTEQIESDLRNDYGYVCAHRRMVLDLSA